MKYSAGQKVIATETDGKIKVDHIYEVLVHDGNTVTVLMKDDETGWDITELQAKVYKIPLRYVGGMGWNVFNPEYLRLIEDACGRCSSSCRRKEGKCEFYAEK